MAAQKRPSFEAGVSPRAGWHPIPRPAAGSTPKRSSAHLDGCHLPAPRESQVGSPRPSYPGADGLHQLRFLTVSDGGQRLDCPAGLTTAFCWHPGFPNKHIHGLPPGPGWLARHCWACPWWTARPGKNGHSGGPDGEERWQALINPRAASREASCPLTAASRTRDVKTRAEKPRDLGCSAGLWRAGAGLPSGWKPHLHPKQLTGKMGSVQNSSGVAAGTNRGPLPCLGAPSMRALWEHKGTLHFPYLHEAHNSPERCAERTGLLIKRLPCF